MLREVTARSGALESRQAKFYEELVGGEWRETKFPRSRCASTLCKIYVCMYVICILKSEVCEHDIKLLFALRNFDAYL